MHTTLCTLLLYYECTHASRLLKGDAPCFILRTRLTGEGKQFMTTARPLPIASFPELLVAHRRLAIYFLLEKNSARRTGMSSGRRLNWQKNMCELWIFVGSLEQAPPPKINLSSHISRVLPGRFMFAPGCGTSPPPRPLRLKYAPPPPRTKHRNISHEFPAVVSKHDRRRNLINKRDKKHYSPRIIG